MMDRSSVGKEGAPFELDVERGKIAEFARAVHATDEAHFRRDGAIAPPTFLTTMFFWEERVVGANPWHLVQMSQERGMHAEQEYVFHGPPPAAGTRLTCRSKIEAMYDKAGKKGGHMTFAVMVTEFRDESGRLVAEARMTGVETERPPEEK